MQLGPEDNLGGHATQDTRLHAVLHTEISDNRGVVAHQDNNLNGEVNQGDIIYDSKHPDLNTDIQNHKAEAI